MQLLVWKWGRAPSLGRENLMLVRWPGVWIQYGCLENVWRLRVEPSSYSRTSDKRINMSAGYHVVRMRRKLLVGCPAPTYEEEVLPASLRSGDEDRSGSSTARSRAPTHHQTWCSGSTIFILLLVLWNQHHSTNGAGRTRSRRKTWSLFLPSRFMSCWGEWQLAIHSLYLSQF